MRIGICLLVRDEIDVIKYWLDYYMPKADYFVITDNGSIDGTRELLQAYPHKSNLLIIDEPKQTYEQDTWTDRMIKKCIGNGCSHVAVIDADEIWDTDFRKLAETLETGAYKLRCKMYVPTIYDDMNIKNPFERMKYCLKKGRTHEEDQCITAWGKVFFNVKDFKNIELGNDKVYFNEKNYETTYIDDVIKHYPNRSLDQYKHKVIISGEAWNANTTKNKNYGWHIRKQYDIYFKGGITALHYHWYEQILEDRRNLMEKVI